MKKLQTLLIQHWPAKLLSLLLAIGIWFLVNSRIKAEFNSEKSYNKPTATAPVFP